MKQEKFYCSCCDEEVIKTQQVREAKESIMNLVHSRNAKLISERGLVNGCEEIFKRLGL